MFTPKDLADTYDQIGLYFSATRPKLSKDVLKLLPRPEPGAAVLDLGCGNGVLLTALPKDVGYTGIDISPVLINEAKRLHPQYQFSISDITNPKAWPDRKYDFIAALAILHHLPTPKDQQTLLNRIKDHLAPGGQVLISVWNLNQPKFDRYRHGRKLDIPFHNGPKRHFYAFTPAEIPQLAKNIGFSAIISATVKNNYFYVLKLGLENK